jgi:hypothetical protein
MNTPTTLQPYRERDRANPYSPKSPDPDKFLAATIGGQPMKRIMASLRAAGEGERVNLFACINAAKHLARHGWLVIDQRPHEKAAIYSPGPRALGKIEDQDEDKEEAGGEESFNPFEKRFTGSQIFAALDQARVPAEYLAAFGKALMNPAPPNTEPAPTPPPDDDDEIPD